MGVRLFVTTPHFLFHDTATTEIYTLSLHDALPICGFAIGFLHPFHDPGGFGRILEFDRDDAIHFQFFDRLQDRKSTRLNSSHGYISYAVFCLKKKKRNLKPPTHTAPSLPASGVAET